MTAKKYMTKVTFIWKICDKILETRNGQFLKLEFTTFDTPDPKNEYV